MPSRKTITRVELSNAVYRTKLGLRINIAVICQAKHEGQVDRFVAKFLDGMPNVTSRQNNIARYGDGFIRRFHLEKPSVTFFTTRSASAEDYATASREALAFALSQVSSESAVSPPPLFFRARRQCCEMKRVHKITSQNSGWPQQGRKPISFC
jgi:hypothetical protein